MKVLVGDCLKSMRSLPSASVQTCVTSPPYFGLRDYGTATWEGGDAACDHKAPQAWASDSGDLGERGGVLNANEAKAARRHGLDCQKCGARRIDAQLGFEATPDAYVAKLVEVFREVRRVLKDDGTVWLNLGDSYANKGCDSSSVGGFTGEIIRAGKKGIMDSRPRDIPPGLKPKDLIGIPWRVAFALQADGWWLRQDIIWHKPNPMPESVTDRCTKAHEYIFLLSKSARYYYDAEAIEESCVKGAAGSTFHQGKTATHQLGRSSKKDRTDSETRNKRSVWTVTTKPYKSAHFATFPPNLIRPCILAGAPVGGVVLDPFGGSGTTAMVALEENRDAIVCELNPKYVELIRQRCSEVQSSLVEASA